MSERGKFLIYCAEIYKFAKHLTGVQVSELFQKYGIWEYLFSCYDALHTTGEYYIIGDIDDTIKERKADCPV